MSLSTAFKESFRKPSYLVVLLVLLVGAVGINAATTAMKLHFRKEALPLRSPDGLDALPAELGAWVAIPEHRILDPEMEHNLGTNKYVFRDYVDTSVVVGGLPVATREDVLKLGDLSRGDRERKLNEIRNKSFAAVMSLAVTYYTGKVDTVPHVPDRCYVADGFQPTKYDTNAWVLGQYASGQARNAPVRVIDFEDQTARGLQTRCVSYFFHANGDYMDDPNKVRIRLQNLLEKYAYFAKIEVMTILPTRQRAGDIDPLRDKDRRDAEKGMKAFLTAALPKLEDLLPVMPGR